MDNSVLNILVIDDHEGDSAALRVILANAFPGAQLFTAPNGSRGMELALAQDPDVILLDLVPPGMEGYEVCRTLKADDRLRSIPVVILTSRETDRASRLRALEEGAEAFLFKPIDEVELTAQVRAMARLRAGNERQQREPSRLAESVAQRAAELERERIERRHAEKQIELLKHSIDTHFDGAYWFDSDNTLVYVNDAGCRALGYQREELLRTELSEISPRATEKGLEEVWDRLRSEGRYTVESVHRRKDGSEFPVEISATYVQFGGKEYNCGFARDITERKRAEEAIRESEARFRSLVESAPEAVFVQSGGRFVYVNSAMVRLVGASGPEELLGREFMKQMAPEFHEAIRERIRLQRETGKAAPPQEQEYLRLDGSRVPVETTAVAIRYQGRDAHLVFVRNITERKQMEEAVRQRTRYIETVMENSPIGFAVRTANDDKARFVSRRFEEICGVPHGALDSSEAFFNLVFADQVFREQLRARVRADHASGDPARLRWENLPVPMASGEVRYLTVTAIPVPEQNLVVSTVQDVTERVRAEQKLRESEKRYRTLFETAGDAILLMQEDRFVDCNLRAIRMFGAGTQDQIVGHAPYELAPPQQPGGRDSRDLAFEKITAALSGAPQFFEWMHTRPDGTLFPAEVSLNRVELGGRVLLQAIVRDITERKRAEEALRESEARYRAILEAIPDLMFRLSHDGVHLDFHAPSMDALYLNPAEFLNRSVRDTLPGQVADMYMHHIHEALRTGDVLSFEYELEFPQQKRRFYEARVAPCGTNDVLTIVREITERKQALERLQAHQHQLRALASELTLAEERERRRIATGLHDHACQTLVLSKMKLQRLQMSLPPGGPDPIADICTTLDKTIEDVREMTFDLSSPALYRFGLEAALKELLTDKLKAEHGIRGVFRDDNAPKPVTEEVRIVLFQSVRELLMNAIKHARAHEVVLDISRSRDSIRITVADDGAGFDAAHVLVAPSRNRGFGLFNIKERLDFIGGTLDVDSRPGRGSRFTLVAPLETQKNTDKETHDGYQDRVG